ncbi:MAG: aryl-sulfate sulfotransferase [Rhodospirillaceae bacterium]|nr:MAG: aryl-sulfate sulfotransferase [Rhodospirillaceae bacterium]
MLRKRSVTISGHRTSISLEDEFWAELVHFAEQNSTSLNAIIAAIDGDRETNLSSAIRLFILANLKAAAGR